MAGTENASVPADDPRWLAHRYDRPADGFQMRWTERSAHRRVPFLTDAELGEPSRPVALVPRAQSRSAPGGDLHFVFHSAFCNSTLLTRALDRDGVAMGLSEPVVLNDVVGIRRRQEADAHTLGAIAGDAMRLLARPWTPGEAVVVKPSTIVNPIAGPLLAMRPGASAVVMAAPLPLFLNSVARKGLWCRLWVRELAEGFLRDGVLQPIGIGPEDLLRQSDLQVAAVGWLAQMRLFHDLAQQFGLERVRGLDSEAIVRAPAETIAAVGRHLGLAINNALATEMAAGPALTRHSKSGEAFDADARARSQAATAAAHGEEIGLVLKWAEVFARDAAIPLEVPAPLTT